MRSSRAFRANLPLSLRNEVGTGQLEVDDVDALPTPLLAWQPRLNSTVPIRYAQNLWTTPWAVGRLTDGKRLLMLSIKY